MRGDGRLKPLDAVLVAAATLVALAFRPWNALRAPGLRNPWVAMLVLLPCLWGAQLALPLALPLQLTGVPLLVLMFGWPFAVVTILPVAIASALLGGNIELAVGLAAWDGVVPATLALAVGMATRRWLPKHVFVYILARGFFGTVLAMFFTGLLHEWLTQRTPGSSTTLLLTAGWLVAWGEGFATGALTAIFVAFRPDWLLTYSDSRYLRRPA
ncbi:MAG: energy-coupling factor ABC transporter permease [Proteobacteria bacterium]|nr:energy-coupling factor ABC transporter permease [Pseudomonadota bacterium]